MLSTKDYACVIENQVYYGNSNPAKKEYLLTEIGVNSIVDLIKYYNKKPITHSSSFNVFHLDVEDDPTNNIDWCEEPAKFIDEQLSLDNKVYVHCEQGVSRSTALIIYYLITRKKQNLKQTFDQIRNIRSVASPNYGFMKGLSELEEKLFGKVTLSPLEYSLQSLYEYLPSINKEEIKKIYEETENELLKDKEKYNLMAKSEKMEPVGYYTIDKLLKKYGPRPFKRRVGCTFYHPFKI